MQSPWPYPFWIAHRGGGDLAPENTLAAFRTGLAQGWRMAECDVKLSADGVPYLLHDDTLERTTSGHGLGDALPWSALARLDAGSWFGSGFAGEAPARLDEVATLMQATGAAINLEIKPLPGQAAATGAAVAQAAARLWADTALPPLLSSFERQALAAARDAAPALPRALLLEDLPEDALDAALALGCIAVIPHHALVKAPWVKRAHAAGLQVLAYTVNDPAEARRLLALGLSGLISDALDRFVPTETPTVQLR